MLKKYINKTSIIFSILFVLILGGVGYIVSNKAFDDTKIKNLVISQIDGKYTKIGNFTKVGLLASKEPQLVLTKYDLFKPKYSLINNDGVFAEPKISKNDSTSFEAIVFDLERSSILSSDWKVTDFRLANVRQTTNQKTAELAKKYDLTIDKPDGVNIGIMSPLTPQQIQANQLQTKTNTENQQKFVEFNKQPIDDKIKFYQTKIDCINEAIKIAIPKFYNDLRSQNLDQQKNTDDFQKVQQAFQNGVKYTCSIDNSIINLTQGDLTDETGQFAFDGEKQQYQREIDNLTKNKNTK